MPALHSSLTLACCVACVRAEDEESEEEGSGEEGVLAQFVSGEEDIPLIDETHRLAVVDLEWERMRAVDIFAVRCPDLLSSSEQWSSRGAAVPGSALVLAFWGQDSARHGVPLRLWTRSHEGGGGARPSGSVCYGRGRRQVRPPDVLSLFQSQVVGDAAVCSRRAHALPARSDDEETAALDAEKLRVYERERLRFYYAIVECDSAATAASLYKQCDGLVRARPPLHVCPC